MKGKILKSYRAAIYLRLSKEDGDVVTGGKQESNSISNQKDLVLDFLMSHPEIEVVSVRVDDGYSGVDFNRPDFQRMLEDIKNGIIDCVVVKDLSRFGRNYIETGRYLERIFPALGVRFISVNDGYDSEDPQNSQDIMVALKNLINDSYLRDLSLKIRSHLAVKRKNGEFIGNYAAYGYLKDENNKNQLVIDVFAAAIVKDIFRMKLEGYSPKGIADRLNKFQVLSPMEYKNSIGINFQSSFKTHAKALWSAQAVLRILTNEVYIGVLAQGKTTTPNHKIKIVEKIDKSEWTRKEHTHEAIIDSFYFDIVQMLLERDTRCSQNSGEIHPLCGMVFCADCGSPMFRKINNGRKTKAEEVPKKYVYYLCKESQRTKECTGHRINEDELFDMVLEELQGHIRLLLNVKDALDRIDEAPALEFDIKKLNAQINKKEDELKKAQRLKMGIYEDFKDELLDEDEYQKLRKEFNQRILDAEEAISLYEKEIEDIKNDNIGKYAWMEHFREYRNIPELTRKVVAIFINRILIHEDKRITVVYNFRDEIETAYERLRAFNYMQNRREAS